VVASYSLFFIGVVINNTLSIHFLTYYVDITVSRDVSFFQSAVFVGSLAGVVFWMRLSRILEKQVLLFIGNWVPLPSSGGLPAAERRAPVWNPQLVSLARWQRDRRLFLQHPLDHSDVHDRRCAG